MKIWTCWTKNVIIMNSINNFKHLLEYFIAHLEYINNTPNSQGYKTYIEPIQNFKQTGQGWKGDTIQKQISQWDKYPLGVICINIQGNFGANYKTRKCYLNWKDTGVNIVSEWSGERIARLLITDYQYWHENPSWKDYVSIDIDTLGLFKDNTSTKITEFYKQFTDIYKHYISMNTISPVIKLLESNHNLILTGAPGTGKTYLAQQIAREMGCSATRMGFVQFHPSYDYTDFVEGLRPKQDESGNIGFEPKDGIFKKFCENALQAYLSDADNAPKYVFIIDEINRGEISKIFGELFFSIDSGYRVTKGMIDDHRSGKSPLVTIRTQYSNMCKRPNAFDEALGITDANDFGHFFVPDNVYIIGTMNDIDRSVESMDFAFRRRFAFKEIKASENLGMLDEMEDKDNIIKRMKNLNAAIEKEESLSSAYHIGGSYFMKLKLYQNEDKSYDYDSLWNNHLEGLLMEYLRGMADAEKKVKELKEYYDLKQISSRDVDNE